MEFLKYALFHQSDESDDSSAVSDASSTMSTSSGSVGPSLLLSPVSPLQHPVMESSALISPPSANSTLLFGRESDSTPGGETSFTFKVPFSESEDSNSSMDVVRV